MKNFKFLNNSSLLFIIAIALILSVCVFDKAFAQVSESRLVELANQERINNGLNSLEVSPLLYFAAFTKAEDMLANNYFEHYSPSGKSPWYFIRGAGYNYQMAGENLAINFKSSDDVHAAWMVSPSHRDNILKYGYKDIGIAAVKGDFDGHETTVVVEMFGKLANGPVAEINNLFIKIHNFILGVHL